MTKTPETLPDGRPMPGLPEGYDGIGEARRLLRTIRSGSLATLDRSFGFPFASLINVATDHDGSPILLLSGLSAHTKNLDADPRCSVLLAETGKGDALAHPRLTVTGHARRVAEDGPRASLKRRFLARHPKAALYADFGDFAFWRLDVAGGHLNGGFAKAADYGSNDLLVDCEGAEALLETEESALGHLNADHAEALGLYATKLAGEPAGPWRATGLDPEGLDLTAGDRTARITFGKRIAGPEALRDTLVELAQRCRAAT